MIKKAIILFSVIIAGLSIVLAPILLPIVFPEYKEAVEIIQIMSLAVIPITIVSTYVSKFLGSGNSKIVLIGSGVYIGIQVPTIIVLTTMFGVNGTAASIVIANFVHAIYFILINRRKIV